MSSARVVPSSSRNAPVPVPVPVPVPAVAAPVVPEPAEDVLLVERAASWTFVLRDPSDDETERIHALRALGRAGIQYFVFGFFASPPESRTCRGVVVFESAQQTREDVRGLLCPYASQTGADDIAPHRGGGGGGGDDATRQLRELADACKASGDFVEGGFIPGGGTAVVGRKAAANKRAHEESTQELIRAGRYGDIPVEGMRHVAAAEQRAQRERLELLASDTDPIDGELPHEWFYGPVGSRKYLVAHEHMPDAYLKSCDKWWDGYMGQPNVIVENIDRRHRNLLSDIKTWGDRYPFRGETRNNGLLPTIRPVKIIVTSHWHPRQIWDDPNDLENVLRRFRVRHFPLP